jgi:hypothetical protein
MKNPHAGQINPTSSQPQISQTVFLLASGGSETGFIRGFSYLLTLGNTSFESIFRQTVGKNCKMLL